MLLDGDSQQAEDQDANVIKLPGTQPERTVFQDIFSRLNQDLAVLTVFCQRAHEPQETVHQVLEEIATTNRDPHLLFTQIGIKIGFVPEAIVRGAFLALWVRANPDFCNNLAAKTIVLIDAHTV